MNLEQILTNKKIPHCKKSYFLIDIPLYTEEKQPYVLDFSSLFGNRQPVVLEIGCGRGELIAALSQENKHINYLGVELSSKRIAAILKKIDPCQNPNVRLIKAKVDVQFLEYIPGDSLEKVIILHPDPWPKRKHHKKRLINRRFLDRLAQVIKSSGEVLTSTDDKDYAEMIAGCFSSNENYKSLYEEGFRREPFWDDITTHFEHKTTNIGRQPYYMRYKLRDA